MYVQIVNKSKHQLPEYKTDDASGLDLRANIDCDHIGIMPLERVLIPTGLYIAIPRGYEAQVRPRSGLAIKHGITVLNTPGTIDADYRGEICVILINLSNEPFTIYDGDRIAQIVFSKYEQADWEEVTTLPDSVRSDGGFGHSGVK